MAFVPAASSAAIALVGMPGCGKSTVGRHLARQLGWRFVDSDHEIERQIGGSIRTFFEQQGEVAFRDLEQQTIAALTRQPEFDRRAAASASSLGIACAGCGTKL